MLERSPLHPAWRAGRMLHCSVMTIPPADLSYLQERLRELATQLSDAWESTSRSREEADAPTQLSQAMLQLIDLLRHIENEELPQQGNPTEINTLSEYGLHLLDELAQCAAGLEQPALAEELEQLSLPYAVWIARQGGEIRHLEPVVNALARLANQANRPAAMATLYAVCCELVEAASPTLEESAAQDPQHPWRLLLLNRAIVATRSHNPELMEPAFDAVVEHLPGDAQGFFAEGMEQMVVIDYPDHVRELMRRYFLAYAAPKRLH